MIISHNRVKMDPVKVAGVAAWPTPENKKDVQQFLGFTNFYRRFIWGYSRIARPLNELLASGKLVEGKKKMKVVRGPFE